MPSSHTEKSLRQFGVQGPLVVVGRGVNVEYFSPDFRSTQLRASWGASENTRVMLYVGRLSPEKEVNLIINAYQRMPKNTPNSL